MVYAPLRISPLGAHVDHQDGLVTGMIYRVILLAFTPRRDRRVCVESLNFPGCVDFALDDVPPKSPRDGSRRDWGNYVCGAALALQQRHVLRTGIDAVVGQHAHRRFEFLGGGRGGAAGLETANDLTVSAEENIQLDRYIENEYLGLKNGIMDQSMILKSEHDTLTYLDCQSVAFEKIPIPHGEERLRHPGGLLRGGEIARRHGL